MASTVDGFACLALGVKAKATGLACIAIGDNTEARGAFQIVVSPHLRLNIGSDAEEKNKIVQGLKDLIRIYNRINEFPEVPKDFAYRAEVAITGVIECVEELYEFQVRAKAANAATEPKPSKE